MIITVNNLTKHYGKGEKRHCVFDAVSFELRTGDSVALIGDSGAGKTTLLNILASLDSDYTGTVLIDGVDVLTFNPKQMSALRSEGIGYVFQEYGLIESDSAAKNVSVPLLYVKKPKKEKQDLLESVLSDCEITDYKDQRVNTLSGGQRQRVAIARAAVNRPKLFLADEPFGSLNDTLAEALESTIFEKLQSEIVVISTHQPDKIMGTINRVFEIKDGKLSELT